MISIEDKLIHGVPEMDDEHRELIKMANDVVNSFKTGDNQSELLKLIEFLAGYVETHFHNEEALQKKYQYPKFQEHKAIHDAFKRDFHELYQDIKENGLTIKSRLKLSYMTTEWISDHIGKTDKEFAQFILSQKK